MNDHRKKINESCTEELGPNNDKGIMRRLDSNNYQDVLWKPITKVVREKFYVELQRRDKIEKEYEKNKYWNGLIGSPFFLKEYQSWLTAFLRYEARVGDEDLCFSEILKEINYEKSKKKLDSLINSFRASYNPKFEKFVTDNFYDLTIKPIKKYRKDVLKTKKTASGDRLALKSVVSGAAIIGIAVYYPLIPPAALMIGSVLAASGPIGWAALAAGVCVFAIAAITCKVKRYHSNETAPSKLTWEDDIWENRKAPGVLSTHTFTESIKKIRETCFDIDCERFQVASSSDKASSNNEIAIERFYNTLSHDQKNDVNSVVSFDRLNDFYISIKQQAQEITPNEDFIHKHFSSIMKWEYLTKNLDSDICEGLRSAIYTDANNIINKYELKRVPLKDPLKEVIVVDEYVLDDILNMGVDDPKSFENLLQTLNGFKSRYSQHGSIDGIIDDIDKFEENKKKEYLLRPSSLKSIARFFKEHLIFVHYFSNLINSLPDLTLPYEFYQALLNDEITDDRRSYFCSIVQEYANNPDSNANSETMLCALYPDRLPLKDQRIIQESIDLICGNRNLVNSSRPSF